MSEYARCTKHNLMRCGICNRPPKVTMPMLVTSVPAVGFIRLICWISQQKFWTGLARQRP